VLFLDEPTTGLDPTSRAALWREVRALNDEGTTVFLTTQYLEEAEQLADRVGIIAGGRLVAEGTPAALKERVSEPTIHVELVDVECAGRGRDALAPLGTLVPARESAPNLIELHTPKGAGAIASVIRALDDVDVAVGTVTLQEPTLDDVFIEVTGSTLEGAAG
jgi:ABC-2 type transport system ATP-binding protein